MLILLLWFRLLTRLYITAPKTDQMRFYSFVGEIFFFFWERWWVDGVYEVYEVRQAKVNRSEGPQWEVVQEMNKNRWHVFRWKGVNRIVSWEKFEQENDRTSAFGFAKARLPFTVDDSVK